MNHLRNSLIGLLLVAVVGALGYFGYQKLILPKHACDICGREMFSRLEAHVFLKDGGRIDACCPRCALHFDIEKPTEVARLSVEDSITSEAIDARAAFYLEASGAQACHPGTEHSPREPGVPYEVKFDRCLPSLIAFKNEVDARGFQKHSGGRLLSFTQAAQSAQHRSILG